MTEALSSSETSVRTRATRRNILEDDILHSHRRENLKSYTETDPVSETLCFLYLKFRTVNKVPTPITASVTVLLQSISHIVYSPLSTNINIRKQANSVAVSPQAKYTDCATATCWRNLVPTFADRGVSRGQRGGSLTVVNLSFLDRNRYFFFQVAPHSSSQELSGPRSRLTAMQKIW
jgi:hypothetical protein